MGGVGSFPVGLSGWLAINIVCGDLVGNVMRKRECVGECVRVFF